MGREFEACLRGMRLNGWRWGRAEPGFVAISYATERETDRLRSRRRRSARNTDVRGARSGQSPARKLEPLSLISRRRPGSEAEGA